MDSTRKPRKVLETGDQWLNVEGGGGGSPRMKRETHIPKMTRKIRQGLL